MTVDWEATVSENIKKRRKELGLSQEQLGEMANLSRATINMVENGTADIRLSTLVRIAQALYTSPGNLFAMPWVIK